MVFELIRQYLTKNEALGIGDKKKMVFKVVRGHLTPTYGNWVSFKFKVKKASEERG